MKSISQIYSFLGLPNPKQAVIPNLDWKFLQYSFQAISLDSRKCDSKSIFVALKGLSSNGNDYIENAMSNGVKLVLTDSEIDFVLLYEISSKIVFIPNLKGKLASLAQWFCDYKKPVNVIGITGTNGKTSISNYIAQFLTLENSQALLLGTNGNGIYPNLIESTHTTLDILSLYETIAKYEVDNLVMEVSSHSLDQGRTKGLDFGVAVFSNLSLDHLDYHKTMENYFLAKAQLFQNDGLKYSIINIDDEYGKRLVKLAKGEIVTVSLLDDAADIYLKFLSIENMVTSLALYSSYKKIGEYETTLLGDFNLMNLALSIAVLRAYYSFEDMLENIANIQPVKGRMEKISIRNNIRIIIDYAHTPDALENVLKTLQQYSEQKLWCIFGCGGNRDTSKRAIMGSIAEKYADNVIVTEDNNRFETVESIFADIKTGFETPTEHTFINSREEAIKYATTNAENGDIILLAGKGHECYLDKNGVKEHFDEREIIDEF